MNKTIIVGLLFMLGSTGALAEVTIYGSLNASIESVQAKGSGTSELERMARINTGNSYLGLKGNEDLGDGLKAIWQIDSNLRNFEQGGVNDMGQPAILGTRNTFVGLDGHWGRAYVGYSDSAYKALSDWRLDPFVNTTGDMFAGIFDQGAIRMANSVHYFSPTVGGFKAGVSYSFDESKAKAKNGSGQNNHRLSIAGRYDLASLSLGLGYDVQGSKLNATQSAIDYFRRTFTQASASYLFPSGTTVGAAFERDSKANNGVPNTTQDGWIAAVTQNFGRTNVSLAYSAHGKLQNAIVGQPNDYKASQWLIGAMYDVSKNTQWYAFATRINNKSRSAVNFSGSVAWVFDHGVGTPAAGLTPGNNPQSIGVGMRVSF